MTEARPMIPAYPALARSYDAGFRVDDAYKAGLPDLQNGPASLIIGARKPIQHVGISNFRLPIRYQTRDGGELALETSVTGTVRGSPSSTRVTSRGRSRASSARIATS